MTYEIGVQLEYMGEDDPPATIEFMAALNKLCNDWDYKVRQSGAWDAMRKSMHDEEEYIRRCMERAAELDFRYP